MEEPVRTAVKASCGRPRTGRTDLENAGAQQDDEAGGSHRGTQKRSFQPKKTADRARGRRGTAHRLTELGSPRHGVREHPV